MDSDRARHVIQESLNALLGRGALDRELAVSEIPAQATLDDLGLDSVTTAMLLQEIEDSTGTILPEDELVSMENFGQFVELVARSLGPRA